MAENNSSATLKTAEGVDLAPLIDGDWYWVRYFGLFKETEAPAQYKEDSRAFYSVSFSGVPVSELEILAPLTTPAFPATEDSSAGDLATESVLIEGVAYTIPEPVALELLRLNIELQLAEVQAEPVAKVLGWVRKNNGEISSHFHTYEPHCDRAVRDYGGEKIAVVEAPPQAQPADALDAARLMFLMDETDGFVIVEKDKYDFAIECAGEAGREEPTEADELNGVRRLLDAAMAAAQEGGNASAGKDGEA